jgi:hypothetical protein
MINAVGQLVQRAVESDLLLMMACAVLNDEGKKRLRHLLSARSIDWQKLFRLAKWHGTYPLIARHLGELSDLVPANVLYEFREKATRNTKRNFLFAAELIKLKALLDRHGIEFITYKGLPLSLQSCGDLDSR